MIPRGYQWVMSHLCSVKFNLLICVEVHCDEFNVRAAGICSAPFLLGSISYLTSQVLIDSSKLLLAWSTSISWADLKISAVLLMELRTSGRKWCHRCLTDVSFKLPLALFCCPCNFQPSRLFVCCGVYYSDIRKCVWWCGSFCRHHDVPLKRSLWMHWYDVQSNDSLNYVLKRKHAQAKDVPPYWALEKKYLVQVMKVFVKHFHYRLSREREREQTLSYSVTFKKIWIACHVTSLWYTCVFSGPVRIFF